MTRLARERRLAPPTRTVAEPAAAFASTQAASILGLQGVLGNHAVSTMFGHVQRQLRPAQQAVCADVEEVPISQDDQVAQNDDDTPDPDQTTLQAMHASPNAQRDDDPSIVQAMHDGASVQRQDPDIPPPPPAFPTIFDWLGAQSIIDATTEAWGMTCADGLERAFVVMWNETRNKIWAGPTFLGSHDAVKFDIPPDRPPVYPVGAYHTHPKPKPGFTRTPGPSSIDNNDAATNHLPHDVHDFADKSFDCRKAGHYFFGPSIRPG